MTINVFFSRGGEEKKELINIRRSMRYVKEIVLPCVLFKGPGSEIVDIFCLVIGSRAFVTLAPAGRCRSIISVSPLPAIGCRPLVSINFAC